MIFCCLSKANLFNFMDEVEISVSAEPGIVEKTARLSRSHRSLRHNNYLSRFSVSFAVFLYVGCKQDGLKLSAVHGCVNGSGNQRHICDKRARLTVRRILPERHEIVMPAI